MKRSFLVGIGFGVVVSLFLLALFFKCSAENMLFKQIRSPYDFDKTVSLIVKRISSTPGWHVVTVINQEEEIEKYGGPDVGKVKIIKFCNAKYAGEMLSNDRTKFMAVKMPLSIAVYEDSNGEVKISLMNGYLLTRLLSMTPESKIMEKVVRDIEKILGFVHFRYSVF
ncbi:DUF302 domain-containing protein [Caminibacter pacificus]|uniref:DUF302 domain-containing protein n=1 Tax=Caminibacter pacificus TaxID=1424653 RepID=A0AAJ4UX71_9BACT|nr:DUF302 domain-containing protein [Caminibacter pacificus]NPA87463.1 DUF302 domain-containing protein [Campylobacterota bacterium]QCI27536.1 DUF302 domain-containing protein [Caminibacter pacificus]ROR38975.1 uncharacterized protein (DUF302 family) [Caminibacter pacificus]